MNAFLIILSAPSGTGKTTIARALVQQRDDVVFSISATTRPPREGEVDGRDYYFLDRPTFERRIQGHEFLEWAEYGDHLYGTLHEEIDRIMRTGRHVILDIETVGARMVRQSTTNVVSVFILPPSGEELVRRLRGRRTEDDLVLARRLRRAVEEIEEAVEYDYIVVNDEVNQAIAEVTAIIDTEVRRPSRLPNMDQFMNTLRDVLVRSAEELSGGKG